MSDQVKSPMDPLKKHPGSLIIPCPPQEFGKFISNLLGKPQTISKALRGGFDIGLNEISNLHHLLSQRINQQNRNSLIQFTCRIVFDDNSSVLLNSYEDLQSYNEVRAVASTQVHLHWSYLVFFEDRNVPEKQDIEVSFLTELSGPAFPLVEDEDGVLLMGRRFVLGTGLITITIRHTARTWGSDIESLLAGHLKGLMLHQSWFREFIWRHSDKIGLGVSISFFMAAVGFSFWTASHLLFQQTAAIMPYLGKVKTVDEKVDFLLSSIARGVWPMYFFGVIVFLVVAFALSIIFGVWVSSAADTNKPSFIVLTAHSTKKKQEMLLRYNRKFASFIASILVGILTGLVSNWIFATLWR